MNTPRSIAKAACLPRALEVRSTTLMRTLAFATVLSASSIAWAEPPQTPVVAVRSAVPSVKCTPLPQPGMEECAASNGRALTIRLGRIGVEMVLATLLGGGLGALGAYAGLNADLAAGNEAGAGLGLGASFGVALGVGTGVWLGGRAMGGDGSFGWTLLGSAVGTAISAGILAADSRPGLLFFGATIPVAFSVLAFELSAHVIKPHAPAKPSTSARVIPSVGPRYVGVAGAF